MRKYFHYVLAVLMAAFFSTGVFAAATCQKTGEVCVDGPGSKNIGGTMIYRACWDYQATYNCVDPNPIDYCAAIANTPGCNLVSSVCNGTAFNGTCLSYTKTYHCGNSVTVGTGVVQLGNNYTIVSDTIDTSPCASYSSNPSCQLSSKTCVDGPSTKNINGLDVYKDCWQWKEDYNCVVSNPADYCMPLKQAGCTQQSDTCTNVAFTGTCIEKQFTYLCGSQITPLPTNVQYLSTSYTIVTDQTDPSQCATLDNNPNCTVASQTCVEGPETRNINGLDVYKDCWAWKKDYTCASTTLTSTCDDLKNNPLCSETGSTCVDTLPGGQCGLLEHQYKCADAPANTTTQTDCGIQTFCVNGQCFDTGHPADGDFAATITQMELAREATNYNIFKGESQFCHNKLLKNCCKAVGGGEGGRNDVISQAIGSFVLKAGAEEIYVWGSKYIFEGLMNTGSEMLQEYAMSALADGTLSMSGTFSVWGAEFAVSTEGGIAFVGFDPWSLVIAIVIYIIMDMMSCDQDDQILGMKRGQGLCHQVGSWCSSKILGACVEKKEGWCCFPSKLGRIVNEQGRPQIGKSWGSAQNPDCSGFTLEELKLLRFDEMDLSEFFNSVQPDPKTNNFAVDRLQQKAASYYGP